MNSLRNYWSNIKPSFRFLKETLQTATRDEIERLVGQDLSRDLIDPYMLKDSSEFLRLSLINLLGYKSLVCGNYLAWGRVTIYYSQFYVVNCLLRLKGFALVHLRFPDKKFITLRIDKVKNQPSYRMQKSSSNHRIIWKRFSVLYPNLASEDIGKFSIQERIDWNYNLFFASQTTSTRALRGAEERCMYNFLDPKFGVSYSAEEADHYQELMASFGYEEAGTGDYIKYALDRFLDISKESKWRDWYVSLFKSMLRDIDILKSRQETKDESKKWIDDALSQLTS